MWRTTTFMLLLFCVGCGPSEQELKAKRDAEARVVALKAAAEKEASLARFNANVAAGKDALQSKEFDKAIHAFRKAIAEQDDESTKDLLQQAEKARKEARFKQSAAAGKDALQAREFDKAISSFREALAEQDDTSIKELLQQAEKAQKESRIKLFVASGQEAMQLKQYQKAIAKYQEALSLQDSAEIQALKDQAEKAWQAQIQAAYDAAALKAKHAGKAGRWTEAVAAWKEALSHIPGHATALQELNLAEYQLYFTRGNGALDQGQFVEAMQSAKEALKRLPRDEPAEKLLQVATLKRRNQLIAEGRVAMGSLEYPRAIQRYNEAKQLGNSIELDTLLTEAQYQLAKLEGRQLLESRQYAQAINKLQAALRLRADEAVTRELLNQALEGKKQQDRAEYAALLQTGKTAMQRKNYAEAIKAFRDASNKLPAEGEAGRLLADAERAKTKNDNYKRHMSTGKGLMLAKSYSAAEASFAAALLEQPGDADAVSSQADARRMKDKKMRYDSHMSSGNSSMSAKNYAGAIASYEAALRELPGDSAANSGITRARAAQASPLKRR